MATHSRILAWRTPQTEEPGGLQSKHRPSDTTEHGQPHGAGSVEPKQRWTDRAHSGEPQPVVSLGRLSA